MNSPLHIVCLDVPAPPNYGGAIDMYYKIEALSKIRDLTVHTFDYKSNRDSRPLAAFCKSLFHYKRGALSRSIFSRKPFIVDSRINKELIYRLNQDTHPILLEGIHCAGILPYLSSTRKVVLRMHNDEAEYYQRLSKTETNTFKKAYYLIESRRLKKFQAQLYKQLPLACLSDDDMEVFRNKYGFEDIHFIPSFIPWQTTGGKPGIGDYCLYHGNMEVAENKEAAVWLQKNVFAHLDVPFYIAGKGIDERLETITASYPQTKLFRNPSNAEINKLVKDAQINVLPSFNNTGVKLKLLHALSQGRHCLTNKAGIAGAGFSETICIATTPEQFIKEITRLFTQAFTQKEAEPRTKIIASIYNNEKNAAALSALL